MSSERWVTIDDDGKIYMVTENDGHTFMKRGPERSKEEISLGVLKYCYPCHFEPTVELFRKKNLPLPDLFEGLPESSWPKLKQDHTWLQTELKKALDFLRENVTTDNKNLTKFLEKHKLLGI